MTFLRINHQHISYTVKKKWKLSSQRPTARPLATKATNLIRLEREEYPKCHQKPKIR